MMKVGILGCGVIARKMANTLRMMRANGEDVCLYAAAARDLQRAQAFCEAEGFSKAYGSYEALAQDENVDPMRSFLFSRVRDRTYWWR